MQTSSRARILIVEDDRDIATSLEWLLADEGYRVQVSGDGVAAIQSARAEPPDLILLDLMLPRMDGVAVAAELKRIGLERVPLILLSAGQHLAEAARAIGTPYTLRKPFDLDEILVLVARALRESGG